MKIRNLIIISVLALVLGFGAGYISQIIIHKNSNFPAPSADTSPSSSAKPTISPSSTPTADSKPAQAQGDAYIQDDTKDKSHYILKEHLGCIAIYKSYSQGDMTLINIIDVGVDALPEQDRTQLSFGIDVYGEENLLQLIEDYTS